MRYKIPVRKLDVPILKNKRIYIRIRIFCSEIDIKYGTRLFLFLIFNLKLISCLLVILF